MSETTTEQSAPDSLKQPAWHVLVLCWVTSIAYLIYWSYKNWRDFSKQAALVSGDAAQSEALKPFKDISPLLRSIGLFVPVLNLFLIVTQFLSIAQLVPDEKSLPRRSPLLAAGIIFGSFISLTFLFCFPPPFFFLGLLSAIPFAFVQHWINQYWDSVEPSGRAMRHAFSVKELIVIIFGGMLQGLTVAGYMLGVKP
ncbi:MAG: hypothetical protein U0105_15780 [Candidatus Obscuribacterales bacterium]|jgi:threonine/homoserine/homoserine lactone efflux protein